MSRLRPVLVCLVLGLFVAVFGVHAQAARLEGTWTMDVQGANRQRTVVVTQEGGTIRVMYGWKDGDGKLGPTDATVDANGVLTIKTRADSVIVVSPVDENT